MSDENKRKVYIFDTSALSALHRLHTQVIELPQQLWDKLANMMQSGDIISHIFVYNEAVNEKAEHPDMLTAWLIPKKNCFQKDSVEQALLVASIVERCPGLIDPGNEKEQADPWLIAQAIVLSRQTGLFETIEYVVVTQENKQSSKKIPQACKQFEIDSMNLKEFFHENSIKVSFVT
jgi:hypothetical protein